MLKEHCRCLWSSIYSQRTLYSCINGFQGTAAWFTACLMDYFTFFPNRDAHVVTLVSAQAEWRCWTGQLTFPQGGLCVCLWKKKEKSTKKEKKYPLLFLLRCVQDVHNPVSAALTKMKASNQTRHVDSLTEHQVTSAAGSTGAAAEPPEWLPLWELTTLNSYSNRSISREDLDFFSTFSICDSSYKCMFLRKITSFIEEIKRISNNVRFNVRNIFAFLCFYFCCILVAFLEVYGLNEDRMQK